MIKNRTIIEVEVKGRVYRLECTSDSPLVDVSEALASLNSIVTEKINTLQTQQQVVESEIVED